MAGKIRIFWFQIKIWRIREKKENQGSQLSLSHLHQNGVSDINRMSYRCFLPEPWKKNRVAVCFFVGWDMTVLEAEMTEAIFDELFVAMLMLKTSWPPARSLCWHVQQKLLSAIPQILYISAAFHLIRNVDWKPLGKLKPIQFWKVTNFYGWLKKKVIMFAKTCKRDFADRDFELAEKHKHKMVLIRL